MSGSQVDVTCSPLLGEHTAEVLGQWLGMSAAQIEEYVAQTPVKLTKKQ
jgi:crotonobetainyl-CoA:carnitine CoA-transferase CaiB-like acyl-CoA transferase